MPYYPPIRHELLHDLPADDDHPQYARTDGTREVTGDQTFQQDVFVDGSGVFTGDIHASNIYGTVVDDSTVDHGALTGLSDDDHVIYHTDGRALTWLGTRSTTDLPEGTNLYYTNERADDRVDSLLIPGSGLTKAYDDAGNALTLDVDPGDIDHAGLSNLDSANYSHLTSAQVTDLTDAGDSALHYHSTDRARANHTGTQLASTISDFSEAVDDRADALIIPGSGMVKAYDDAANTLTLHSSGAGVTDHGALTGLADDDHAQYLLASDATSRAAFATNWIDLTDAGASTLHKHDHGGQDGLADDDHTQYLLLVGRSGGQTAIGGTDASNTLTIKSTSHATKGKVIFGNAGTTAFDEVSDRIGVGTASPSQRLHVSGSGDTRIKLQSTTAASAVLEIGNATHTQYWFVGGSDGFGYIRTDSSTKHIVLQGGGTQGQVLIGTITGITNAKVAIEGGHILWATDNTYDIGASAANRPRDLFIGRNGVIGGILGVGGAASQELHVQSSGETRIKLQSAGTNSAVLEFGNATRTHYWFVGGDGHGYIRTDSTSYHILLQSQTGGGGQGKVGINNVAPLFLLHCSGTLCQGVPNSAPTDANIGSSEMTAYVDQTAHTLLFRVKYSDGTLKLGTVALV